MRALQRVVGKIKGLDIRAIEKAQKRQDSLTKPQGSLGILEEISLKIAGITGKAIPKIKQKAIIVIASDHGVVEEGVSLYPQEVTAQMVYNFLRGGAGINVLARYVGAKVVVVDMGVASELKVKNAPPEAGQAELKIKKINYGTENITRGPAMTRIEAISSIEVGIEVVEEELEKGKIDILATGDMGIGNTTPSSAIAAVFTKAPVEKVTGRGTGIDDETFNRKVKAIKKALQINKPNPDDPIDVLAKVGGFEIGGLAGVILAGASQRIPVAIDGFISSAAALIAVSLKPLAKEHLIATHNSAEIGHKIVLESMNLKPLLELNLRLGEGTGAALGISLVEAATRIINEMSTFEEAAVSKAQNRRC